jgi:hypothetical protein
MLYGRCSSFCGSFTYCALAGLGPVSREGEVKQGKGQYPSRIQGQVGCQHASTAPYLAGRILAHVYDLDRGLDLLMIAALANSIG